MIDYTHAQVVLSAEGLFALYSSLIPVPHTSLSAMDSFVEDFLLFWIRSVREYYADCPSLVW